MARQPKTSKTVKFPIKLDTGTQEPPSLTEYWYGDKKKHNLTDDEYDEAVQSYEDTYGTITFDCDCVVFNLEEWADIDCFYPENKKDEKPFDRIYRRSYNVSLRCETWWEDCTYNNYVGHGKFSIESDNGFFDDLKEIKNKYVRSRVKEAFYAFISNKCQELGDASGEEKTKWEPDEWHATYWGSPLD